MSNMSASDTADMIEMLKGGAISALIKKNDKLPFLDLKGNTALIWCADAGQSAAVKVLLDHKADINYKGISGNTALMRASRNGHKEVAELLLKSGADVALQNTKGQTALHFSSFYQHLEVCRLLCQHGAPLYALDRKGRRPAVDTRSAEIKSLIKGFELRRSLTIAAAAAAGAGCIVAAVYIAKEWTRSSTSSKK